MLKWWDRAFQQGQCRCAFLTGEELLEWLLRPQIRMHGHLVQSGPGMLEECCGLHLAGCTHLELGPLGLAPEIGPNPRLAGSGGELAQPPTEVCTLKNLQWFRNRYMQNTKRGSAELRLLKENS